MINKLIWLIAFIFKAILYTLTGIVVCLWNIWVGIITITFSMVMALLDLDLLYFMGCLLTLGKLFTKYPINSAKIVFRRVRESYDMPMMLRPEKGE